MSVRRAFTETEDAYIRRHYLTSPYRDIGDALGRNEHSIQSRVNKLGLTKMAIRRWAPEEEDFIRANLHRPMAEVADHLGRLPSEVGAKCRRMFGKGWRAARGYRLSNHGYVVSGFTRRNGRGVAIFQHRAVMEEIIGRSLSAREIVHHINENKVDNRPENLYLCADVADHMRVHRSLEKLLPQLLDAGIVTFNRTEGVYELCATGK